MTQGLRVLVALAEDQGLVPTTHWLLTSAQNPSSRGLDVFFCLLWEPSTLPWETAAYSSLNNDGKTSVQDFRSIVWREHVTNRRHPTHSLSELHSIVLAVTPTPIPSTQSFLSHSSMLALVWASLRPNPQDLVQNQCNNVRWCSSFRLPSWIDPPNRTCLNIPL